MAANAPKTIKANTPTAARANIRLCASSSDRRQRRSPNDPLPDSQIERGADAQADSDDPDQLMRSGRIVRIIAQPSSQKGTDLMEREPRCIEHR